MDRTSQFSFPPVLTPWRRMRLILGHLAEMGGGRWEGNVGRAPVSWVAPAGGLWG